MLPCLESARQSCWRARLITNEALPELDDTSARRATPSGSCPRTATVCAACSNPLVIVLEDAQWADSDSLGWVDHLLARAAGSCRCASWRRRSATHAPGGTIPRASRGRGPDVRIELLAAVAPPLCARSRRRSSAISAPGERGRGADRLDRAAVRRAAPLRRGARAHLRPRARGVGRADDRGGDAGPPRRPRRLRAGRGGEARGVRPRRVGRGSRGHRRRERAWKALRELASAPRSSPPGAREARMRAFPPGRGSSRSSTR